MVVTKARWRARQTLLCFFVNPEDKHYLVAVSWRRKGRKKRRCPRRHEFCERYNLICRVQSDEEEEEKGEEVKDDCEEETAHCHEDHTKAAHRTCPVGENDGCLGSTGCGNLAYAKCGGLAGALRITYYSGLHVQGKRCVHTAVFLLFTMIHGWVSNFCVYSRLVPDRKPIIGQKCSSLGYFISRQRT